MTKDGLDARASTTITWFGIAALSFWAAWLLMPGVGITDTLTIFGLVGQHRAQVLVSVCLQLLSAASYAPAIVGLLGTPQAAASRALRCGAGLLAVGAMGSAADAIFHLVAYEMTAPSVSTAAMVPVMQQLQGPDLKLLAPMILAFFAAHAVIAWAARHVHGAGRVSWMMVLGLPVFVAAAGAAKRAELVSGRVVGLGVLALVSFTLPLAIWALVGGSDSRGRVPSTAAHD